MAALSIELPKVSLLRFLGLGLLATGCRVYMPTLPYTPLVQQRGQAEVGASVHLLQQAAVYGAYSPVNHLVITASGAKNIPLASGDNSNRSTQGDVGFGYYRLFGATNHWFVGALGGVGWAATASSFLVSGSSPKEYRAHYSRLHGQLYLARVGQVVSVGATARFTTLRFSTLTFNEAPVTEPVADRYGDWAAFIRVGRGAIQGQAQVGASTPLDGFFKGDSDLSSTATLVGVSLIFRPHLSGSGAQAAPELK